MSIKLIDAETGELLPAPRNLPTDMFLDFERQDNESIIAELRGEIIEEYAYSFTQGGQTIVGLSLPGVMSVAQQMGGITCGKPEWTYTDDDVMCDIAATDHKTGLTFWGTASEPRVMHTKYGDKLDKFARQKALSKAQRNAILKLIPATVAKKALEMALEKMGKLPGKNGRSAPVDKPRRAEPVHAIDAPPSDGLLTPDQAKQLQRFVRDRGYTGDDMRQWMALIDKNRWSELTEAEGKALAQDAEDGRRPWLPEPPIESTGELIGDDFDAEDEGGVA